ncbi:MAG TPA: MFS transporter [Pseudomonadales bacterium]|nr:MFS transporter [Pseudomonadales bacterium]
MAADAPRPSRLPFAIWALGMVSLFGDVASEMIFSLLPAFLTSELGASALMVGLIVGMGEATALTVKIISGPLSDRLGQRKWLALVGYGMAALMKPFFAIAGSPLHVLFAHLLDRTGKGIRGAPRDALIADITPPSMRGAAYGLRQALDSLGAILGPLLALVLMALWANNIRAVFWVAAIPAAISVIILFFGVQEPAGLVKSSVGNPLARTNLRRLPPAFWHVVLFGGLFTLARFNQAFLVLRVQQGGLALGHLPMVLVAMNVVYALSAYPLGKLADRMAHKHLLAIGMLLLVSADLLLAHSNQGYFVWMGVGLWGLHMGATQGLLAAMVADTAPTDLRGTAFGVFNLVAGLALLCSGGTAGLVWDHFGARYTFIFGASMALLALVALLIHSQSARKSRKSQI